MQIRKNRVYFTRSGQIQVFIQHKDINKIIQYTKVYQNILIIA
jgi:hypothetical protein